MRRFTLIGPAVARCVALLLAGGVAGAQDLTRDEALALVFPGAVIRGERVFLTPEQQSLAAERAGVGVSSQLVARYIATSDGQVVGRAYVDTNTVRTKKETLLISLDPNGHVRRVDVTAFLEPSEYRPPETWLRQYGNRPLSEDLGMNRAIRSIAGATLTARAVNAAVRRALAIDQVLQSGGRP